MDSDDLEFAQWAATALDMSDREYEQFLAEFYDEDFLEESEPEYETEGFYRLARGDWDDWLEADDWYEISAEYEEH